jgi:type I restriction enzyme S subunit
MKEGWEIKTLGEVCDIFSGSTPLKSDLSFWQNGDFPWFTIEDIRTQGRIVSYTSKKVTSKALNQLKVLPPDTILLCCTASVGEFAITTIPLTTNQQFNGLVIRNQNYLKPKYLYYFCSTLKETLLNVSGKTTIDFVSKSKIQNIKIPIPPLLEQQRIVSIIDKAFEAIDNAIENTQKNLQNAKELLDSYLNSVFENGGEGWEKQLLVNSFKLKSGENLFAKNMVEGEYPVYGGNGISGYHNQFNLSGNNVIIGRVGALCGNVRHITENIWLTDNAFRVVDLKFDFDNSFLTYLLNYKNLRDFARQSAQPVISNSSLKDVILNFPKSKMEQLTIVEKLDNLISETRNLEAKYQQKLANLGELKKSVLNKAFAGEL